MTNDELRAVWAQDINSHERFTEAFQRTSRHLPRFWQNYNQFLPQRDVNTGTIYVQHDALDVWPLQRDMIRESIGFYPEATSVLKYLRTMNAQAGLGQMFPHVSPINRDEIAFTPDANQAKADRKQRMSVGRFLRKFLMYAPDAEIQRLDQQHRSELDTEFELAETVEAIRRVYVGMVGDSGCMRYDESHFDHAEYHPSAVYASPGMGVAYTEDEEGNVKSRSVIWVNPEDASDKRYVRIYGDPILKKKLEANGFKMRGLVGAKFRILRDPKFQNYGSSNTIVMPWIDPAGGIHATNVDRSYDSEHAIRFKGEDMITLISAEQKLAYERAGIYAANVQSQSGHVDVPEVDPSTFQYTCAVSNAVTNRMDVATVMWLDADGTVRQARSAAVSAIDSTWMHIHREGRLQRVYCAVETKPKFAIPGHPQHFNDEDTREAAGLCMLDKAFYADSERYHSRRECVAMQDAEGNNLYIKKEDALMLYTEEGADKFIHIDMVKAMKSEGCVPVAVLNGYRGLAHKAHPQLAVTRGGKRILRNRHDVIKLWDDTWEYSRNVVNMNVAGLSLSVSKNEDRRAIVVPDETVRERFAAIYAAEPERREYRMLQAFQRGFDGGGTWMRKDDQIVQCDYYNKAQTATSMVDAARAVIAMKDDSEWMQRTLGYQRQNALPWARVVVAAWEGWLAYEKEQAMMMAEANAVEAAPSTQAVVAHLNTLADADMDRLIAEVDDTLATAVVRRWPRLQAAGIANVNTEQRVSTHVAAALDQMEAVMGSPDGMGPQRVEQVELPTLMDGNGTLVPVRLPMHTPHMDVPIAHPDRIQAAADDALLRELQSVGLAPIVIDEHTDFNGPEFAPLRTGDAQ